MAAGLPRRGRTLYDVLEVARDASLDEIKAAFKRCALQVHPDKGGSKEAFHQVYQAFHTLGDQESRKKYDSKIAAAASKPPSKPSRPHGRPKAAPVHRAPTPPSKPAQPQAAQPQAAQPQAAQPRAAQPRAAQAEAAQPQVAKPQVAKPQPAEPQAAQPSKSPDEFLLKQIRSCLQRLSREDRFQIIRKDFSQLQRLLFEEWMRSPASKDTKKENLREQKQGATSQKRKKMSSAGDQRKVTEGRGRANVRGIASRQKGKRIVYFASLGFNNFMIRSRECELPVALEYLMVITAATQRVKVRGQDWQLNPVELQRALEVEAEEHGIQVEAMGLKFFAEMAQNFWFGFGNKVHSPLVHTVPEICRINNVFNRFRSHFKGNGRRPVYLRAESQNPMQLHKSWEMFQVLYAEIWSQAGISKDQSLARIRRLYESAQVQRDRRLQKWELKQMRRADTSLQPLRRKSRHPAVSSATFLREKLLPRWLRRLEERRRRWERRREALLQKRLQVLKERREKLEKFQAQT